MKKNIGFVILVILSILLVFRVARLFDFVPLYISPFPNEKNFAFTIIDDPDGTRLNKIKPVYEFLDSVGLKTTIACWVYKPVDVNGLPDIGEQLESDTLANEAYLKFINDYKLKGFEIAMHTATAGHDKRKITIDGYERFKDLFGEYPKINIMHSKNRENVYWGRNVFSNGLMRMLVGLYDSTPYSGENRDSMYFWGDICNKKTKYVRLWGTADINTLKFNPSMPYHDLKKPLVNYWFSFSDGYNVKFLNKLISETNIRKLVRKRGACIVYTHFAAGFCRKQPDGTYILNNETKKKLLYVARQKDGWFVPVSIILDRLLDIKNIRINKVGNKVNLTNLNPYEVKDVAVVTKPFLKFVNFLGKTATANDEGEIFIGNLLPQETKTIFIKENIRIFPASKGLGISEKYRLIWERLKIMIFSHRG